MDHRWDMAMAVGHIMGLLQSILLLQYRLDLDTGEVVGGVIDRGVQGYSPRLLTVNK